MLDSHSHSHFRLPILTPWQRTRMLKYAEQALTAQQAMLRPNGESIIQYALKKKRVPTRMQHYPQGDRIDHTSGAQYFYHCHRENFTNLEHGHFHCFLRYKQIPKYIKPMPLTDWDKYIDNPMTHLVAIALNQYSQPIRLFLVNRWVVSDIWYYAKHVALFINKFKINKTDNKYWHPLDLWIESILHLFSPQIMWLNQKRDIIIKNYMQQNPGSNYCEDNTIEDIVEIEINMQQHIQWLLTESVGTAHEAEATVSI